MTRKTINAAIKRHRAARHLIRLANMGIIDRRDAVGEMSKARAQLKAVIAQTEIVMGRRAV